jgi:pimeloyl-ACP methyl ester carboxylesterase
MAKPQLLLLPGLVLDHASFAAQTEGLRDEAECTVVSYGSADSIEEMARVALSAAPPRFSVAGHSMGGRVAARIWSVAPERVERFALLNTGHRPAVPGERERRYALWQIARDKGMRAMAAEWLPALVPAERLNDREFMEPIYEMICRKTPEIFEAQIGALLNRSDSEAVLRSVNVPSLVLAGRNDNTAPLAGHEEMARSSFSI